MNEKMLLIDAGAISPPRQADTFRVAGKRGRLQSAETDEVSPAIANVMAVAVLRPMKFFAWQAIQGGFRGVHTLSWNEQGMDQSDE